TTVATKTVTVTQTTTPPAASAPATPRSAPPSHTQTPRRAFVSCDANIRARAGTTTCGFASNVFWEYWTNGEAGVISAWSPATKRMYSVTCHGDAIVVCTAGDGGEVRFRISAVAAYDQGQADAYAASHDGGPDGNAATATDTSSSAPSSDSPASGGRDPSDG